MLQTDEFRKARLSRDPRFDGKFFIGVKTTGIFCRPVCPAKLPAEQNVEYLPSAETALQSGYRPCIRCRPDSAPESWAWLGTETTVSRAARLIAEDPAQNLSRLCDRLGIGERHLRALFNQHVGMSPKQYQLCQRLLFAKHILQDSNLPIHAVAQAAGFNSARSLQQQFQQRLRISPLKLRHQSSSPRNEICLRLYYRPPYHWEHLRDFLEVRAIPLLESVGDDTFSRQFDLGDARGKFTAVHKPERRCFELHVDIDNLQKLKPLVKNIRRVLDLDADPGVIGDSLVEAGVKKTDRLPGIRLPGAWSVYEAGCRAVCGQQVSVSASLYQVNRLVEKLGRTSDGQYSFPKPLAVARSSLDFLGMPQARRDTLRNFSRLVANNPDTDPGQWLEIAGIGPWTVDYARLRGTGHPDIWLESDLVIRKMQKKLNLDAQHAAPWRSYLTLQLWSMA